MILAIFASMAGTIGKQLLRLAELQKEKGTRVSLHAAKLSMVAALSLMTVIGPLIDMGSYAFAPQSMLAPLGALDIVWNTVLAPFTLGESLSYMLIGGCVLIAGGAVASSSVGGHEDKKYTLQDIQDLLFRWEVVIYLGALAGWIAFHMLVPMQWSAAPIGQPWEPGSKLRGLSLGIVAGSIAGNMFCVKAFVEIVQLSIADQDSTVWAHWLPYTVLVGALFFAFSNLYFLTKGMHEFEALFMGAVFEGTLIMAACLSGGIVFKEFDVFQPWEACIYVLALASICGGIFAIAKGSKSSDHGDERTTLGADCDNLGIVTSMSEEGSPVDLQTRSIKSKSTNGTCGDMSVKSTNGEKFSPFRGSGSLSGSLGNVRKQAEGRPPPSPPKIEVATHKKGIHIGRRLDTE